MTCTSAQVKFESYFPNSADGKDHLQTETAVESSDFNEYVLAQHPMAIEETSVQLIFCLSEMRVRELKCSAHAGICVSISECLDSSRCWRFARRATCRKFSFTSALVEGATLLHQDLRHAADG